MERVTGPGAALGKRKEKEGGKDGSCSDPGVLLTARAPDGQSPRQLDPRSLAAALADHVQTQLHTSSASAALNHFNHTNPSRHHNTTPQIHADLTRSLSEQPGHLGNVGHHAQSLTTTRTQRSGPPFRRPASY